MFLLVTSTYFAHIFVFIFLVFTLLFDIVLSWLNDIMHKKNNIRVYVSKSLFVVGAAIPAMVLLLIIAKAVPAHAVEILIAGVVGCITFVLVEGITSNMGHDAGKVASAGAGLFVYLNILDAAFSLDGVIGAFAISSNLLVIMVGLGVGAYFVRSFTVMLVEKKTLSELMYLEHGAHWAVGGLGVCMLLGLIVHIPEVIIGVIGLCFVAAAYVSSVRYIK